MRIGLIDVDGHNYPNLPLMKISAWHKQQGDSVEWYSPMFSGKMDRVYMSKVFSFTPDYEYFVNAKEIYRGGGQDTALNWLTAKRSTMQNVIGRCRQRSSISILTIPSILN